jgi:predicted acetyltransferase
MTDLPELTESTAPAVTLEPIAADQAWILRNLFQLYAHDFSEFLPLDLRPDGCFDVPLGDLWWTAPTHHPFFLRRAGKLCGFALVQRGSRVTGETEVMDVSEFFVVRGLRRSGVGRSAALTLFSTFPGRWELRVRPENDAALRFWLVAAGRASQSPPVLAEAQVSGETWSLISFENRIDPRPT